MSEVKFEIGGYYKHTTGHMLHILVGVKTTLYGETRIAEVGGKVGSSNEVFMAVGNHNEATQNYVQSTEEEWMKNFS